MQIFVKTVTGKTLAFETDGSDTLRDLKIKVQEREMIPLGVQRFIFDGSQLFDDDDGLVLDLINAILRRKQKEPIKGDSDITLWLVYHLRGGGNQIYHRPVFTSLSDSESDDDELLPNRKDKTFSRSDHIKRNTSSSSDQSPDQPPRSGSSESAAFNGAYAYGSHQVKGLPDSSKPSVHNGVYGDDAGLHRRNNELASNDFPEMRHHFWIFLSDARISMFFVMLMIASAVFLVPKAMIEVWDWGIEDGKSIALPATLLIVATAFLLLAIRHCRRPHLRQEKQKLYLEVLRDGKRVKVSASDVIAGDFVLSEQQIRNT